MPRGGKREGAGRPPGSKNKKTKEQQEAVAATGQTPLEYLVSVFQDEERDERVRIDAAKAAAPFVHAKLSNVEMKTLDPDTPADDLSDTDLQHIAKRGGNGAAGSTEMPEGTPGVQSGTQH